MGLTTCTVKHSPAHIHTHIHTQAALRRVQVEVKDLVERHPELMDTALVSHIRKVLLLPPKKEPAVDTDEAVFELICWASGMPCFELEDGELEGHHKKGGEAAGKRVGAYGSAAGWD